MKCGNRSRSATMVAAVFMVVAGPVLAQTPPPQNVGVIELQPQPVARVLDVPGRAVASEEVAIRPRVGGIISEILYRPGTPIDAGTPMFRIDPLVQQAAVTQAQSDVVSAEAVVRQARTSFERAERLVGSGATQAEVDNLRATLDQAEAALAGAQSRFQMSELELSWTTVSSPISGIASLASVTVGDLVAANQQAALATVTRLDPIEVDLLEPAVRLQRVLEESRTGQLRQADELTATLTLESGRQYEARGELVAPGTSVSMSTGAIEMRFRFENPEGLIIPGMFLRGRIVFGESDVFLVPQTAARRDQTGAITVMVVEDGHVVQRALTATGSQDHHWIVPEGLEPGTLLIVDALSRIAPGMEVVPVPATVGEDGVVRPTPQEAPSGN